MRAILTYHSIDDSGSPVSVSAAAFRAHATWLASGRVQVVSLEALAQLPDSVDAVALTFDDGFQNFEEHAAPLLIEHGFPSTVFVVPEHVGQTNDWGGGAPNAAIPILPLMSWEALGRQSGLGVTIGAHTRRHRDLTLVRGAALEDEVAGCVERIAAELGMRPSTFAYPYGGVDVTSATVVRDVFELACTTELRALRKDDDRALLPRLDMFYFRDEGQLESWGTSAFKRRLWLRAQGRKVKKIVQRTGRAA
jgi:peptidoglycan/xylan/chitin deacetylase (PgdA/CDA1 family)